MESPIICREGMQCSKPKSTLGSKPCTSGKFCLEGAQGDDPFNIKLETQARKCPIGSGCKGTGISTGVVMKDTNSSTPLACKQGHVCPEGSESEQGLGACPSGYYCPLPSSLPIKCPPRHYCPKRGNVQPLPCPKGTFNLFYGQRNCTECTIGSICPLEGLLLPLICPPGYVCNEESLVTPITLCRPGHFCLEGRTSGILFNNRSCSPIHSFVADEFVCDDYKINYNYYKTSSDDPTSTTDFDAIFTSRADRFYLDTTNLCCWNTTELNNFVDQIGKETGSY